MCVSGQPATILLGDVSWEWHQLLIRIQGSNIVNPLNWIVSPTRVCLHPHCSRDPLQGLIAIPEWDSGGDNQVLGLFPREPGRGNTLHEWDSAREKVRPRKIGGEGVARLILGKQWW